MKAKNRLRGMLWPVAKQLTNLKYLLFHSGRHEKDSQNRILPDIDQVHAETERISEKLQDTLNRVGHCGLENKYPGVLALPENKPLEPEEEDSGLLLSNWRDDEEYDRSRSNDYEFWNYRQNLLRADYPDIMESNLLALFKADHDAAQYEQYKLENERIPPEEIPNTVNQLRRFLSGGLYLLLTVVFILGAGRLRAQELKTPHALRVGDAVPDVTIQNIINYKSTTAKLSDFNGKLLILDFWASWCAVCIPSLTRLDSLQQQFGERIMILPVSSQPTDQISAYVEKKGWRLPSVTSSNELEKLFPHRSVPHQVWIKDGKVKSITAHFSATAANIRAVLDDKPVGILGKNDKMDFDAAKPMMLNGNGGPVKKLNYQSLITGYMDGLGYTTSFTDGIIQVTNNSALYLYSRALEKQHSWLRYKNRIIMEVPDSLRNILAAPAGLKGETEARWYIRNGYCYNLVMPPATPAKEMAKLMHADLNRFFNAGLQVNGEIEPVKTKCLVLKRTGNKDLLKSSNGPVAYSKTEDKLQLQNKPFKVLVDVLTFEYSKSPMPLVDESNYTGPVDLELSGELKDLSALRKELKKYGLSLEEEYRELAMLVIRKHPMQAGLNSTY